MRQEEKQKTDNFFLYSLSSLFPVLFVFRFLNKNPRKLIDVFFWICSKVPNGVNAHKLIVTVAKEHGRLLLTRLFDQLKDRSKYLKMEIETRGKEKQKKKNFAFFLFFVVSFLLVSFSLPVLPCFLFLFVFSSFPSFSFLFL